jgi:hypothetical protein
VQAWTVAAYGDIDTRRERRRSRAVDPARRQQEQRLLAALDAFDGGRSPGRGASADGVGR